jgi:hypothetical protein
VQAEAVNTVTVLTLSQRDFLAIAKSRADLGDILSRIGAEGDLAGDGCSGRFFYGVGVREELIGCGILNELAVLTQVLFLHQVSAYFLADRLG